MVGFRCSNHQALLLSHEQFFIPEQQLNLHCDLKPHNMFHYMQPNMLTLFPLSLFWTGFVTYFQYGMINHFCFTVWTKNHLYLTTAWIQIFFLVFRLCLSLEVFRFFSYMKQMLAHQYHQNNFFPNIKTQNFESPVFTGVYSLCLWMVWCDWSNRYVRLCRKFGLVFVSVWEKM